jgi:hypothetical protein
MHEVPGKLPGELSKLLTLTLHGPYAEHERTPPDELGEMLKLKLTMHGTCEKRMHEVPGKPPGEPRSASTGHRPCEERVLPGEPSKMLSRKLMLTLHELCAEHERALPGEPSKMLMLSLHALCAEHGHEMPLGELIKLPGEQRSAFVVHGIERSHEMKCTLHGSCLKRMHEVHGEPPGEPRSASTVHRPCEEHALPDELSKMLSRRLTLTLHGLGAEHKRALPGELSKMLALRLHEALPGELIKMLTLSLHGLGAEHERAPQREPIKLPGEQ